MVPQPIRIVYLIDSLGVGGAERVLLSTLQHLDRVRFEPRVAVLHQRAGNPLAAEVKKLGVRVDTVSVTRLRDPRSLPRVIRYIGRSRADLLHAQLEFSVILGGVAARVMRIPCVSTLHTFDDPTRGTRDAWRARLMWWSLRRMHTKVIAVSEAARLYHIRRGGLAPDKVLTLYNGVDTNAYGPRDEKVRLAMRAELGIAPGAPLLVSVAVLREPKGLQYLIRAMRLIVASMPEARLVIVGEGDYGPTLRQQVASSGLDEYVVFTGMRTDVADLLAMSDVFVLPTSEDVLPTVVAEAMAVGLPVVASDVGGLPEMVDGDKSGLLVRSADPEALADACTRLLGDRAKARLMGLAGREIAEERFDARGQTARLGSLYVSLVAGHEKPTL